MACEVELATTSAGSFTVTQVTIGESGVVESFAADFEQHCEGSDPALRGHVDFVNAPAPREVGCNGTTSRQATVSPAGSVPFGPGSASLSVDGSAYDVETGERVTASAPAT